MPPKNSGQDITREQLIRAGEQVWQHTIAGTVRNVETAQHFLHKFHGIAKQFAIQGLDAKDASMLVEVAALTGLARVAAPALNLPMALATAGTILVPYVSQKLRDTFGSQGTPSRIINEHKVYADMEIRLEKKIQYSVNAMTAAFLTQKNHAQELSADERSKLDRVTQENNALRRQAEASYQKMKNQYAPGVDDPDPLKVMAAHSAEKLGRYATDKLADITAHQQLLEKLSTKGKQSLSPEELKNLEHFSQQYDQKYSGHDLAAAHAQNLVDSAHFRSGQDDSFHKASELMTRSHAKIQESLDDLKEQQVAIANALSGQIAREHAETRHQNKMEHIETRRHIQKVGELVGQVSTQVFNLTQYVVSFASTVGKALGDIQQNQINLLETFIQSSTILHQAIRDAHQQIMWMHYDVRYSGQYLVAMDQRHQVYFEELLGAQYQKTRQQLLTYFSSWGKPTENAVEMMRNHFADVITWATIQAKSTIIAGTRPASYTNDVLMQKQIISMLSNPNGFERYINYWVGYAHDVLGVAYDKTLVNPLVWSECALLILTFPELLTGFSNNAAIRRQVEPLFTEGNEVLKFLVALKVNGKAFEKLFAEYEQAINNVIKGMVSEVNIASKAEVPKNVINEYIRENIIKGVLGDYDRRVSDIEYSKKALAVYFQKLRDSFFNYNYPPSCVSAPRHHSCAEWASIHRISYYDENYGYPDRVTPSKKIPDDNDGYTRDYSKGEAVVWSCLNYFGPQPVVQKNCDRSYKAIIAVIGNIITGIENLAIAEVDFLKTQVSQRKKEIQSENYQLPFDLFEDSTTQSLSSWSGELRAITEHTYFEGDLSYPIARKYSENSVNYCTYPCHRMIILSQNHKEIYKLWLQAEYLGLGKIDFNVRYSSIDNYFFDIKFDNYLAREKYQQGILSRLRFSKMYDTYEKRNSEDDCIRNFGNHGEYQEKLCGLTDNPLHKIFRTWLYYKYGHGQTADMWHALSIEQKTTSHLPLPHPVSFVSLDGNQIKVHTEILQENVNMQLLKHRLAIASLLIPKIISTIHESGPLNQALLALDATHKKLTAYISWAYPELLENAEFIAAINQLYDQEKIKQHVFNYQKNPSGKFIHQILEDMLAKPFKVVKKLVLKQAALAKTLHDEGLLDIQYPLVQETLGWLNAFEHHHFPSTKPKIYTAADIYRAFKHNDSVEIAVIQSGKHNLYVVNTNGNTVFHLAVKFANTRMLHVLLPLMNNTLNTMNGHQQSPIDLALAIDSPIQRERILLQLIVAGAYRCADHFMIERKYFTLIYEQPITVEAWKRKCVELPKEKTIARCEVIFNADDELSTEAQAEKKMCEQTADRLERTVLLCNSIFNTEVSLPARVDSARRLCEHPKDVVVNTWQPTFFNRFCSWLTTGNGLQKIADSESPVNVNSVNMNL